MEKVADDSRPHVRRPKLMREQEAMATAVRDGTCEVGQCDSNHLQERAIVWVPVPVSKSKPPRAFAGNVTSADSQFLLESQNDLSKLGAQQRVI